MNKVLIFLFFSIFILNSCKDILKSDENLIGNWRLSEAFNSEGMDCSGLDETKNCIYNQDQTWKFKIDSTFITQFTSVVNINFGDTIILTGKYKTYKERENDFLEIKYEKFTDSSGIKILKIVSITDTTLEYIMPKYSDGTGGMRFIFKKI